MKIKSIELIGNASNVNPSMMTATLFPEEYEFLENGWFKWREKNGQWYACPPSMIRNVGISEEVPTNRNMPEDNSHVTPEMMRQAPLDAGLGLGPKRRGRPKQS